MNNTPKFATIDELQAFWRPVYETSEIDRAESLLSSATTYLKMVARNNGVDIAVKLTEDTDGTYRDVLKLVVLSAVKRAMTTPIDAPNADQWSQSASPYSETIHYAGGSNDLFFKNNELQLLGLRNISGRSSVGILRGIRGAGSDELV